MKDRPCGGMMLYVVTAFVMAVVVMIAVAVREVYVVDKVKPPCYAVFQYDHTVILDCGKYYGEANVECGMLQDLLLGG